MAKIVVSGKRHKKQISIVRQTEKTLASALSEAITNFRLSDTLAVCLMLNEKSYPVVNFKAGSRDFDAGLVFEKINQILSYSKAREGLMSSMLQQAVQFDINHAPDSFDPEVSEVLSQGFGFMSSEFSGYSESHLYS